MKAQLKQNEIKYLGKVGELKGLEFHLVCCKNLFYTLASTAFRLFPNGVILKGNVRPMSPKLSLHYLEEYLMNFGSTKAANAYVQIIEMKGCVLIIGDVESLSRSVPGLGGMIGGVGRVP